MPEEAQPPAGRRRFSRAARCGECHEQLRKEWLGSAHARAAQSSAFQRALQQMGQGPAWGAVRALCQSCHLPEVRLAGGEVGPKQAHEGVTCDACHTLAAVSVGPTSASVRFDVESGRKYGPLSDPASNYFHGMARSPLHERADLCAGCHHLMSFTWQGQARKIPVVTDYDGWMRYGQGRPCQSCHMPSRGSEPIARGGRVRPDVPSHAFPGAAALGRQLRLELSVDVRAGQLTVELSHAAGHMLPSGHVDRRLLLRVVYQDRAGSEIGSSEQSYGIFLVDDRGLPAPVFRATAVREDRRLPPGRVHREVFALPTDGRVARALVMLLSAPTAPELADSYGEPELSVLRSATVPIGGARQRIPRDGQGAER